MVAWQQAGFSQYLKSSLIITGSVVVLGTVVAISSGYAFGVLGVLGEKLLFPLVLLGLMLPMEAFIVPLYYDFLSYRVIGTYQGIILAHLAWASASVPSGCAPRSARSRARWARRP